MTTLMVKAFNPSSAGLTKRFAAVTLVLAAMGFAGAAQARSDVSVSFGVGIPGISVDVGNAYPVYSQPVYQQPVYVQPAPVYVQPRPVYVQPAPVYYSGPPVFYAPQPVYYSRPRGHGWRHDGYRAERPVIYGPGYGPRGPRTSVNGQFYVGR